MPQEVLSAIDHADMILSLQEDLSGKEMPPEWMWPLHWEMNRWLKKVAADRRRKYNIEDDDDELSVEDGDGSWRNEALPDWARSRAP